MNFSEFRKSWSQAVRESASKNLVIGALVATNALAVVGWFRTKETIVLVPPSLDERMEVSASHASVGYKKAWALMVAELCGNVTPGNADLVLRTLGELLAPGTYRAIAADLATQIADIKRDSLTVSFEPRQILYEPATNKVFVTGQFASQGVSGSPISAIRTYEMTVDIRLGRPWITSFRPYAGMPASEESLKSRAAQALGRPVRSGA